MSRVRKITIGAFVLLLAVALLVPRGRHDDAALTPSSEAAAALGTSRTAGAGTVTPAMRNEIERVVAAGLDQGPLQGRATPEALAAAAVRCAEFDGQRYCLNVGWTDRSPADVRARVAGAARIVATRPASATESTGDLDALAALRRVASLDPATRAELERRELTAAARSVAKVWLLRHEIDGTPLPADFLDAHPEARRPAARAPQARAAASDARPQRKTRGDYPRRGVVLTGRKVAEQSRTYWCGPATMQMIAWAWQGERRKQRHWAGRLGTTTDGSAISDLVRVVNDSTGFDGKDRAGPYVVLDISSWSYEKWLLLNMRHLVDYRAPLVLHPVLLKRYYPYLDDDASGHFQVGRGYDKRGRRPTQIGYFEPWNQQRFDPSEPYISRVQWRSAYKSYRANQDHFQQNIGV